MLRAELGVLLEQHKSVTTIASAQSEDLAKEKEQEGYGNIVRSYFPFRPPARRKAGAPYNLVARTFHMVTLKVPQWPLTCMISVANYATCSLSAFLAALDP